MLTNIEMYFQLKSMRNHLEHEAIAETDKRRKEDRAAAANAINKAMKYIAVELNSLDIAKVGTEQPNTIKVLKKLLEKHFK